MSFVNFEFLGLKQDVMPKLNRRVLENTWVKEQTDLPSPILKNGIEHGETDRLSLNTSMKCSSPLESRTESSHELNNDGNYFFFFFFMRYITL